MNADEKLFYDLCEQYNLKYASSLNDVHTVQDLIDLDYDDCSKSWLISYDTMYKKLYVAQSVIRHMSLDNEPCLRYTGGSFFNIEKFKQLLEKYEKLVQSIKKEMLNQKKVEIATAGGDYEV